MRLVLYVFAVVAGLALAVVALVARLPVATLIFGLLITVVGVAGLVLAGRDRPSSSLPSSSSAPSGPAAVLDRGAALEASGDLDGALAAYREAAEAGDERVAPVGHLRIGTVLAGRNELPAAEEQARAALGYPPGRHTVAATILLASVALRAGKTDLA